MYLSVTPSHRCRHPLLMHPKKSVRFSFHLFRSFAWVLASAFIFSFFIFVQSQFGSILLRRREFRIREHRTTTKYIFLTKKKPATSKQPLSSALRTRANTQPQKSNACNTSMHCLTCVHFLVAEQNSLSKISVLFSIALNWDTF